MKKIIIIGAGVAGISAAVGLINKGYEVTVIESRNIIGGRTYSFIDKTTGELIDNGQHIVVGAYTCFLDLLKELGTQSQFKVQENLEVPFISNTGKTDILKSSLLPGKAGIISGLMRMKNITFESKVKITRFFFRLMHDRINSKGLTCTEVLKQESQTEDVIKNFWLPLIYATLNSSPEKASADLLLVVLKRAFFAGKNNSRLMLPKAGLSELLESFPDYLKKRGGTLLLNSPVKKLICEKEKITSAILNNGELISGDMFISAVPPSVLKKILPDDLIHTPSFEPLDKFRYSSIISIYMWFDKDFVPFDMAALLDTNMQWVFNRKKIQNSEVRSQKTEIRSQKTEVGRQMLDDRTQIMEKGRYALTISGADDLVNLTSEELTEIAVRELKSAFPEGRDAKLFHSFVIKDKHATILITPEIENIRLSAETSVENFFLAGDWTATGLPATIESAAASGYKLKEYF